MTRNNFKVFQFVPVEENYFIRSFTPDPRISYQDAKHERYLANPSTLNHGKLAQFHSRR